MITIISPTTTMNFNKNATIKKSSEPVFATDATYLIDLLSKLNHNEISSLMNLSDELTKLNLNRYKTFNKNNTPKLQSIFAFDGEVFTSMKVDKFCIDDLEFANFHLKIISGLYGVLSPLDLIKPYRLEMKSKLANINGDDLYKFWKNKITNYLLEELKKGNTNILINLASSEYKKSIDINSIKKDNVFIDIEFKEYNQLDDTYKTKGMYAKRARGYMVEYIVKNKIDDIKSLKLFDKEGYSFNESLSTSDKLIFTR